MQRRSRVTRHSRALSPAKAPPTWRSTATRSRAPRSRSRRVFSLTPANSSACTSVTPPGAPYNGPELQDAVTKGCASLLVTFLGLPAAGQNRSDLQSSSTSDRQSADTWIGSDQTFACYAPASRTRRLHGSLEGTRDPRRCRSEARAVDCVAWTYPHATGGLPPVPSRLAAPLPGWTETTDVVVVGSGVAGLTAALHLREAGLHVTVVTKVNIDDGSTRWAQGGIAAVLDPLDTPAEHAADTLVAGRRPVRPGRGRRAGQRGPGPGTRADALGRRVRPAPATAR